jgi:transcriptional regulator with XRE-family HTH domain
MKTARLPFIDYPQVGARLRTLVTERKVSRQELAEKAGVKESNLSRFMVSGIGISGDKVKSIADVLDIDVRELYGIPVQ